MLVAGGMIQTGVNATLWIVDHHGVQIGEVDECGLAGVFESVGCGLTTLNIWARSQR